ncbi:type I-E CRISPR-associated protein Cas5/CasD [Roseomonas sp. E05]|uniref:type I-E CRISPR-associated protein Cas5/CasD n=1 Tax=Roseomonas sp. E05 TaxID=3046310 RepID=UPI0024B9482B|nr:type I-E CRISPR-associated protein Cas5/CasD [Roseomonas sp. E05]MDJ0390906.1 type I-E CRISPR-associated protein Cas5/CasD [Roseomonas sp. E05]
MDDAVLCFRLHGAMAAWGNPSASGGERPSDTRPGRGAVIGILSAALGYGHARAADIARLSEGVWVASASHGELRLAADFRTAQTNPKPPRGTGPWATRRDALQAGVGTTRIGVRQHVEDALWRVFVAARPGGGIDLGGLLEALRAPRYLLSLGRREFPLALPPSPEILAGGLMGAADGYAAVPDLDPRGPLRWALDDLRRMLARADRGGYRLCWDVGFPGAPADGQARPVVDDPASRDAWRFRPRLEAWKTVRPAPATAAGAEALGFFESADEE